MVCERTEQPVCADVTALKRRNALGRVLLGIAIVAWLGTGVVFYFTKKNYDQAMSAEATIVRMLDAATTPPIIVSDEKHSITYANQMATTTLGQMIGVPLLHHDVTDLHRCILSEADYARYISWRSTSARDKSSISVMRTKCKIEIDGHMIPYHVIIHAMPGADGRMSEVTSLMPMDSGQAQNTTASVKLIGR